MSVSNLKVGDKIKVSPNLKEGDSYNIYVNPQMVKHYAGEFVTVDEIKEVFTLEGKKILIEEDEGRWDWSPDMFCEKIHQDQLPPPPRRFEFKDTNEGYNIKLK